MSPRARIFAWLARRDRLRAWALLAPGTLWLFAFFIVPVLIMAAYSVMQRGTYGGVEPGFTAEAYARFFDPLYLRILARTLWIAAVTTLLCLVIGYPMAYAIAAAGRWKHVLLFLVVLPFWTSFLVRTYAIMFLLRDTGLVNSWLMAVGVTDDSITLLYTPGAVLAGLVYGYLPFMVLPVYASLEKLDPALLEAAESLGARPLARLVRVILPLSLPGVVAGSLLVFIPSLGAFLTPDLLGGAKQVMIGNLIQQQFGAGRDWPFGSAASFVLMALVLAVVYVFLRRGAALPEEV
jgi:spermidine/putrescine transport system permease protein